MENGLQSHNIVLECHQQDCLSVEEDTRFNSEHRITEQRRVVQFRRFDVGDA